MEVDNLDTLKLKLTKCEFGFKAGPSTVVSIFINDKNLIVEGVLFLSLYNFD